MHKINTSEIRQAFANVWNNFGEAKMIAGDAGLRLGTMQLSSEDLIEVTWAKILEQAEREGKERELIETVHKRYPGNKKIAQIYNRTIQSDDQLTLFYSYAHEDESLRNELDKHLGLLRNQGLLAQWYDRDISAGTEWAKQIDDHLNTADIILLLISPDFIASDYCYSIEMKRALERHELGEARVIPILLRPVYWQRAPFSKLQVLPQNAQPVTEWPNQDSAFKHITEEIHKVVNELRRRRANS
jgi:hypothetical protein